MTTILVESIDLSNLASKYHIEETICNYSKDGVFNCKTTTSDTPAKDENVPVNDENVPVNDENVPAKNENVPAKNEDVTDINKEAVTNSGNVMDLLKAEGLIVEEMMPMSMYPMFTNIPLLSIIPRYNYKEDSMDTDVEGEEFANFLDITGPESSKDSRILKTEKNSGENNTGEKTIEEAKQNYWEGYSDKSYIAHIAGAFLMLVIMLIFVRRVSRRRNRSFSKDKRRPLLVVEPRVATKPTVVTVIQMPEKTVQMPEKTVQMPEKTVKKESSLVFI